MNDVVYPPAPCSHCGYENTCASNLDDPSSVPSEGDISLCIKCAGFSVFTGESIKVRKPTEDELREIESDVDMVMLQGAVKIATEREANA